MIQWLKIHLLTDMESNPRKMFEDLKPERASDRLAGVADGMKPTEWFGDDGRWTMLQYLILHEIYPTPKKTVTTRIMKHF